MKLKALVTAAAFLMFTFSVSPAAVSSDEPTVDSILAKHISAMGGKEKLQKITSRVMKFKLESETLGASHGQVYAKAPNKVRSEIELDSGTINEGFDGSVAWAKNPWEDLRIKSGDELAKAKRDAEFHRELNVKKVYPDLAYKGVETVEGDEAYILESKPSAGSKERFAFSKKSGLLVRQQSDFQGPQGPVSVQLLAADYKEFDGVKYPTRLKIKFSTGGQSFEFSMNVTEVKHNVPIEDSRFAKPSV
jgi:zinc protease